MIGDSRLRKLNAGFGGFPTPPPPPPPPSPDANTMVLLHFNGDFTDEMGKTWTPTTASIDGTTVKFGSGSGLFPASSVLSTSSDVDFNYGTGNYTVDFWINFIAFVNGNQFIRKEIGGTGNELSILIQPVGAGYPKQIRIIQHGNGYNFVLPTNEPASGTWHHMAIVRASGVLSVYYDGTALDTGQAAADNILQHGVGLSTDLTSPLLATNAYIDEYRESNIARWIGDFTPPTSEYCLPGTNSVVFTIVGTTSWHCPAGVTSVRYLVVAGGGGGGWSYGSGGGAGGFRTATGYPVTPGNNYTVTVGARGNGATNCPPITCPKCHNGQGCDGGDSVFDTIISTGGAGGAQDIGYDGGSGSGAGGYDTINVGHGIPGQGHDGGTGVPPGVYKGGGGGGAGSNGGDAGTTGGNGGDGSVSDITGTPHYYAGGGGGGVWYGTPGTGGSGIGGNGATAGGSPTSATYYGSGGGGGANAGTGGNGYQGIVILVW